VSGNEGDLDAFDFSMGSWNAVMLVGSLVHIPPERFLPTIQKILSGFSSPLCDAADAQRRRRQNSLCGRQNVLSLNDQVLREILPA